MSLAVCAVATALLMPMACANFRILPDWVPIYQGVEYTTGSSRGVTVYAVKVDLWNPYVQLYASHGNGDAAKEVLTETGAEFNADHGCQVSVNASYCDPSTTRQPPTNVDVWGLAVCDGAVVSPGDTPYGPQYNCQMLFTLDKVASIVLSQGTPAGYYTAVTGNAYHLVNGNLLGATAGRNKRTSFGLSRDRRYLYMACVTSATIYEMSEWMIDLGAWNAINMDGGGSSCITRADIGKVFPRGAERRVGIHLGVRAPALDVTPGSYVSPIGWTILGWTSEGWRGVTHFDQTSPSCWICRPPIR